MRDKEYYENGIIKCIVENKIYTQNMIFTFYSELSRAHYFMLKLHESDHIKKALDDNKNRTKQSMLLKWQESESAVLQMGLMKLICDDDERKKLAMNYNQNEEIDKKPTRIVIEGLKYDNKDD